MSQILGCDVVTDSTAVMLEDAALIHHDTWVARALSLAAAAGKSFVLATPPTSVITTGLSTALKLAGANWVVTPEQGLPFDALSGAEVAWDGDAYVTTGRQADHYLMSGAEDRGGIVVEAESLRPAKRSTTMGGLSQAVSTVLTGRAPDGWGVLEPVTEPWDVKALSKRYISDRSAQNLLHVVTHEVVNGGDLVGALRIERPRRGVVERVSMAMPTEAPATDELRQAFVEVMTAQGVRWARLSHVVGFDPATRVPRYTGVPVPSVAVFGSEAVKGIGIEAALEAAKKAAGPAGQAQVTGQGKRAGIAVLYSQEPVPGHNAAVEHLELTAKLMGEAAQSEFAAALDLPEPDEQDLVNKESAGAAPPERPSAGDAPDEDVVLENSSAEEEPDEAPSVEEPSRTQVNAQEESTPQPPAQAPPPQVGTPWQTSAPPPSPWTTPSSANHKLRGRRAARPSNEPPA